MTQRRFTCIVVGAGIAGCSAAIRLAQQGIDVLLVERADEGGAKNLSGGILWGDDLAEILPDWKTEAPVDRPVTTKKVGLLGTESAFVIDYADETFKTDTIGHAVLRARLDPWLVKKAEEAGAVVISGVNVDGLYREEGQVKGVVQGGEVTLGDVVIIADGANSRLTLQGDLRHGLKYLDPASNALGVKQVLKLPKETMEERFGIGDGEGVAGEFVLGRPDGVMAGGFLYTNDDTISLGVVVNLESLEGQGETASHTVVEDFRNHPYLQKLVKGAELVEYGAHLVPEGGYQSFSELYDDGVLVAGDAAGFCFSNGIVIQGMNYAVRSGILAADAVAHAKAKGDFSAVTLKRYEKLLDADGLMGDFKRFKNVGKALWNPRLFNQYPELMAHVFRGILSADGEKKKMKEHLFDGLKAVGVNKFDAAKDAATMGVNL